MCLHQWPEVEGRNILICKMLLMLGQECARLLISCLYIDTAWNHPCQWNRSCYWLQDSGLCPRGEEVSKLKNNQLNKCDFWRFHSVFCQILLCSSYNKSASLSCVCFIWNVLFSCKWKHNLADDIYFKGLIGSYSLVQTETLGLSWVLKHEVRVWPGVFFHLLDGRLFWFRLPLWFNQVSLKDS